MIYSHLDLDILSQIYMVSNTPSYLYTRFRKEDTIIDISKKYKTEEIIETIEFVLHDKAEDSNKIIFLYALIISLTYKPYSKVYKFLSKLEKIKFKWFYEIINIYLQTAEISGFSNYKTNIAHPSFNCSGNTQTTENHFNQKIKPKIKLYGE
jgi:hypothetical protein